MIPKCGKWQLKLKLENKIEKQQKEGKELLTQWNFKFFEMLEGDNILYYMASHPKQVDRKVPTTEEPSTAVPKISPTVFVSSLSPYSLSFSYFEYSTVATVNQFDCNKKK